MTDGDALFRAVLAAPEDAATRMVYADWLEEQGDPRAELLRLEWETPRLLFLDWVTQRGDRELYLQSYPELRDQSHGCDALARLRDRIAELGNSIEPSWLAVVDTLGCPFVPFSFWKNSTPRSFEPDELPFREAIGSRGSVVTFESDFRGERSLCPGLGTDLRFLLGLSPGECYYGSASCPIHPFICHISDGGPLNGSRVLDSLRPLEFRSNHIENFDSLEILNPGYHPGDENDEIHTDPAGQHIFPQPGEAEPEMEEGADFPDITVRGALPVETHAALRKYAEGGRLWYVLLHRWYQEEDEGMDRHHSVVLFAVGKSPHGDRLVGVVTNQSCHNFCD